MNLVKENIENSINAIEKHLDRLWDVEKLIGYEIFDHAEPSTIEDDLRQEDLNEQRDGIRKNIDHELYNIYISLVALLDSLEQQNLISLLKDTMNDNEKCPSIDYYGYADIFYSPRLSKFRQFYDVINNLTDKTSNSAQESKTSLLQRILKSTAHILYKKGIVPANENEIQKELFSHISIVFPDTVRESSIPKVTKAYRPDFSIKSLSTCIEIKFATSEKEARKILSGIYEDAYGYKGYKDWTNFIAVLYLSDQYFTEDHIQEELKMSDMPDNWEIIVVYGKGERIKKAQNNA